MAIGKTKQYQSLSENVKSFSNTGQKPLIKNDEIKQIFGDF